MNRIDQLFRNKKSNILSVYFCAGANKGTATGEIIRMLEQKGIDMIEIGIPFSDPMADGIIIQEAATQALRNGMTLRKLFAELEDIRKDTILPLIMMGYLNPIMQYGFENFCRQCRHCGIDGIIIPDLPLQEYMAEFKDTARLYGLKIIMLITPETSDRRIRYIDDNTDGFIYMVSSAGTTGAQKSFDRQRMEYFERIENMHLKNPHLIGFGISNRQTYETANAHASGCIIGSKFVSLLNEEKGNAERAADRLFNALKQ